MRKFDQASKSTKRAQRTFALYKADECLCFGTAQEIAQHRGIRIESVFYYLTPAYQKKCAKSKNPYNRLTLVADE